MKKLQNTSSTPLYIQLAQTLKNDIKTGVYQYGEMIPNESDLCDMYGVSRITVRNAVIELVKEGVLTKKRGKGTFVNLPVVSESYTAGGSFTISCKENGIVPSTKILKKIDSTRIDDLDDELIQIDRLRLANGIPVIYEVDYFFKNHSFILDAKIDEEPVMDVITQHTGLIINGFENSFEVALANHEIAKALNCKTDFPLLLVKQKVISTDNEIIYINHQYIRSDIYKFRTKTKG